MRSISLLFLVATLCAGAVSADPCALDGTFRSTGIARDPAPQALGKFDAVVRDPRGGYLAAGEGDTGEAPYFTVVFVARYDRFGALDPGYGNGGFARWQESPEDGAPDNASLSKVMGIAAAPDGSALVLGYQVLLNGDVDMQLWRFTETGAIDSNYAQGGVSHLSCGASPFHASSYDLPRLLVDASGRAVVATRRGSEVVAMRVRPDGTPDPAFGTAAPGCATYDRAIDRVAGVVRRPGGYELAGGRNPLWTLRVDDAGIAVPAYGTNGLVVTAAPGVDQVQSVALQGDRVVLGVRSTYDLGVVRVAPSGALDTTFAGSGLRTVPMPDRPFELAFPQGIAVADDGRLAVVGLYDETSLPQEMLVALLEADGGDPTAGCDAGNRIALSTEATTSARGFGAVFDGDRLVVVGGSSERGYVRDETAVAVLAPGVLFRNGLE